MPNVLRKLRIPMMSRTGSTH